MIHLVTMCTLLMLHGLLLVGCCSGFVFDSPDGASTVSRPPLANPPLRIGSFNIQIFGQAKYAKKDVMNIIVKILSRYDVVQILEIRDSKQTAFEGLRQDLNKYMQSIGINDSFKGIVSGRLGRTYSKEQYGFLYRTSRLNATDTYQFPDDQDFFEREPFGVLFSSPSTVVDKFALVATHIKPSEAAEEIDNLTTVYEYVQKHWHLDDIIIAGDFNADCRYVSHNDWATISFRNDARFTWLIDDNTDTTVAQSFCVYDSYFLPTLFNNKKRQESRSCRKGELFYDAFALNKVEYYAVKGIVVGGSELAAAILPGSVHAYRFDEIFGLNHTMTLKVSDHYPIEMVIQGSPTIATHMNIQTYISFTVLDTKPVSNDTNIRAIYRSPSCAGSSASVKLLRENTHMDHVTATLTSSTADIIVNDLAKFSKDCPGILSLELLSDVQAYVSSSFINSYNPDLYGLQVSSQSVNYPVEISCSLMSPYICKVTVTRRILF